MGQYLSVDGGGSKVFAIWFDESMNVFGTGMGKGINPNTTPQEERENSIRTCLKSVFQAGRPKDLDAVHITFLGSADLFVSVLSEYTHARQVIRHTELETGLMAGALRNDGFLAIAGTGSNILFSPPPEKAELLKGLRLKAGGWGAILGDEGSGVWMGKQTAIAAIAAFEGWGNATVLPEMLMAHWQLDTMEEIKKTIYRSAVPYRKLAELTYVLKAAAAAGDETALGIIGEAGKVLADQARQLLNRIGTAREEKPVMVCAGGAWKVHPVMFESFSRTLLSAVPDLSVQKPRFEPVAAGCLQAMRDHGIPLEEGADRISKNCPFLCTDW